MNPSLETALATLRTEAMQELLDDILPFWTGRMPDPEHGGFYGRITGTGQLEPLADRGAILNARILWTLSAAYRVIGAQTTPPTSSPSAHRPSAHQSQSIGHHSLSIVHYGYAVILDCASPKPNKFAFGLDLHENCPLSIVKGLASQAKSYLIDHFYDHRYGGVYWSVDVNGEPVDTRKQVYALAFAIYGLAEYHRATGDDEARDYAISLYHTIEQHSYDGQLGGYLEAFTREWGDIDDMRLSEKDDNGCKTMNTHLHILEAYTNLYRIWPDERLARRLRQLLSLFMDRMIDSETGHLRLFFDRDWTCRRRIHSYGHEIETSWLMHESAQVLGDEHLTAQILPYVHRVAAASLEGLMPDGSMVYERIFDDNVADKHASDDSEDVHHPDAKCREAGLLDTDRHWWVQAENVVGQINLYQLTGDPVALDRALRCWTYIKVHLLDRTQGEWYWSVSAAGRPNLHDDKAGPWKCPYHNGRMCLELIERLAK